MHPEDPSKYDLNKAEQCIIEIQNSTIRTLKCSETCKKKWLGNLAGGQIHGDPYYFSGIDAETFNGGDFQMFMEIEAHLEYLLYVTRRVKELG